MTDFRLLAKLVLSTLLFANLALCLVHVSVKHGNDYCVVLNASQISGQIQYNTPDNKLQTYPFDVNETTVQASGSCHSTTVVKDEIKLQFLPNGAPALLKLWSLHIVFQKNPASTNLQTFASVDYSLDVSFSPLLNSSVVSHVYSNDVMAYEMQSTIPGVSYSCSSTTLKLGHDSWLKFSGLKVIANTKMQNETMEGLSVEKCSADAVVEGGGSSVLLIVGIVLAVLVVLGVLVGLAVYIKKTRMSH
uniref:Lysosome-associated membrane glycoprotein 1 n=1 Tax=Ditylenchus dipsaci TaxID=166011 RepID=A0A915EH51_9BILA